MQEGSGGSKVQGFEGSGIARYFELYAPDADAIPFGQHEPSDPSVVDERAVCAVKVLDLERPVPCGRQAAMKAGDHGRVHDEIRARRTPDGLDRARKNTKSQRSCLCALTALKNPHEF
jgi:hypothetical protein